jgi:hypothetical protein
MVSSSAMGETRTSQRRSNTTKWVFPSLGSIRRRTGSWCFYFFPIFLYNWECMGVFFVVCRSLIDRTYSLLRAIGSNPRIRGIIASRWMLLLLVLLAEHKDVLLSREKRWSAVFFCQNCINCIFPCSSNDSLLFCLDYFQPSILDLANRRESRIHLFNTIIRSTGKSFENHTFPQSNLFGLFSRI